MQYYSNFSTTLRAFSYLHLTIIKHRLATFFLLCSHKVLFTSAPVLSEIIILSHKSGTLPLILILPPRTASRHIISIRLCRPLPCHPLPNSQQRYNLDWWWKHLFMDGMEHVVPFSKRTTRQVRRKEMYFKHQRLGFQVHSIPALIFSPGSLAAVFQKAP